MLLDACSLSMNGLCWLGQSLRIASRDNQLRKKAQWTTLNSEVQQALRDLERPLSLAGARTLAV